MPNSLFTFLIITLPLVSCNIKTEETTGAAIEMDRIMIDGGFISGLASSDQKVHAFKGIPYAKAPIKDLRWKPPAPVDAWSGIRKCDSFGPSAMQPSPEPFYMWPEEFLIPKEPIDEDCLYLNVWTAARERDEKRPVLVWIHGGGFSTGGSSVPIYDGEAVARKGLVFVSINYRLGIFGFFAHPDLAKESEQQASGNYGLMDQIAALKWIQRNIREFGGDSENVTIAGQSAGGASVVFLLASPLSSGLFQKAIVQSGAGVLGRTPEPEDAALAQLREAEEMGSKATRELGGISIDSLRKLPAPDLLKGSAVRWQPIQDGYVLPQNVAETYRSNRQNRVGLLTGWNEDEGIIFGKIEDAREFEERILSQWGKAGPELLTHYPTTNDSMAEVSQKNLKRDMDFGVQNFALANMASSSGDAIYVYRFARDVPAGRYEDYGAFHTAEVPYALDNLNQLDRPFESIDHKLAEKMSAHWVNFAASGNPNGDGLPQWPEYSTDSHKIMIFDDPIRTEFMSDTLRLNFLVNRLTVNQLETNQ